MELNADASTVTAVILTYPAQRLDATTTLSAVILKFAEMDNASPHANVELMLFVM